MPSYKVACIKGMSDLWAFVAEWEAFFHTLQTPNPFAHPLWLVTWAEHFTRPGQLYILVVRDTRDALVGVAPFYRRDLGIGPVRAASIIQLLGTGQHVHLTELPQCLIQPINQRKILKALVQYLAENSDDWDWVELTLAPGQGWFEPQWLLPDTLYPALQQRASGSHSFALHKSTRPCVSLPLPTTWNELQANLKRNVKESLRRGVNRMADEGHQWSLAMPQTIAQLDEAISDLIALHRARAAMHSKVRHQDYFASHADRAFLHEVTRRMFTAGHLTPYILSVNEKAVAARLLLHAHGITFFSCSGFQPAWWRYNVATMLVAECLRSAIIRQERVVNFSTGPDVAKLRWNKHVSLDLYQDFIIVGQRRRSRIGFMLYWQLRHAAMTYRESHRDIG